MFPLVFVAILLIGLYLIYIPRQPVVHVVISAETVALMQSMTGNQPATFDLPAEVVLYMQGKSGDQSIKVDVEHPNNGIGRKLGLRNLGLRKQLADMIIPSDVVLSLQGKVGAQSVKMNLPSSIVADLQGKKGDMKLALFIR